MIDIVRSLRLRFPKLLRQKLPVRIRIIVVPSRRSRLLNRIYREKDRATYVLSFRYDSDYGEIVLCPFVIRREARRAGRSAEKETVRMVAHAMIHLAGVHHESSKRAREISELLEQKILGSPDDVRAARNPRGGG